MKISRRLLNGFCWFLAGLVGSLVGLIIMLNPAVAFGAFADDFDGYSVGDLNGHGEWVQYFSNNTGAVDNSQSNSAPNSAQFTNNEFSKIVGISSSASGSGSFYFKRTTTDSLGYFMFGIASSTTPIGSLKWRLGGSGVNNFYINNNYIGDKTINSGWNLFEFEWDTGTDKIRINVNSGGWSTWYNMVASAGVDTFYVGTTSGSVQVCNVDDLEIDLDFTPPVIEGYAPILTPTLPERNAESVVDFDDGFEVSGKVEIPTANTHEYHDLVITFRKPDNFLPAQTLVIDLGDLVGGQDYEYSATTTIPITESGVNFFKVGYALNGSTYAGSYADNPPISDDLLAFDRTWVKDSVNSAPAYLITPSIKPDNPALEDCEDYSGIDAIICNFRNFAVGAFLPTDEALGQIGGTMEAMKNKFPMNYASAISNTFSAITAGVDDEAGFSMTLLGNNGEVDTSFFTQDIGGGATLGALIKLVLTFLVFMIFLYWGIGYMHRILNK